MTNSRIQESRGYYYYNSATEEKENLNTRKLSDLQYTDYTDLKLSYIHS